jgi:hypothetical protein
MPFFRLILMIAFWGAFLQNLTAQKTESPSRHQFSLYYNCQPLGEFNRQQQGAIQGVELSFLRWLGKKDPKTLFGWA